MNLQPIIEQIKNLNESDLIQLNNLYCSEISHGSEVYDNDEEFFDIYFPNSYNALQRCYFGKYNWNDTYVSINDYGNIESFDTFYTSDLPESVESIAEWCYDNQNLCEYLELDFSECEEEEEI